jgi:hypothetical protein
MSGAGKKKSNDVAKQVSETLKKYPDLVQEIEIPLYRTQPSKYDANPINYKADSDTRYADPDQEIGVFYLGCSDKVAVAESFQPGQGVDNQAVPVSKLDTSSLHQLKPLRPLNLVDVAGLANRSTNHKLRDLVEAKGQGAEGYELTREFSQACMQQGKTIDGLLYYSAVYSVTGSMDGCNVVLFDGRGPQVEPVDFKPVAGAVLSGDETTEDFLESLGVVLVA